MPAVSVKSSRSVKSKNPYIEWVKSPQGMKAVFQKKPELRHNVPALGKELGRLWRQKKQRQAKKGRSSRPTSTVGGKKSKKSRSKK